MIFNIYGGGYRWNVIKRKNSETRRDGEEWDVLCPSQSCISGSLAESMNSKSSAKGVEGVVIHDETGYDARRLEFNWES